MTIEEGEVLFKSKWPYWSPEQSAEFVGKLQPKDLNKADPRKKLLYIRIANRFPKRLSKDCQQYLFFDRMTD